MSQGLIPQEVIERVKERIDIVELVSGYVTLSRAGQNLKALCPFHAEKTPSFVVSPSRQMFHCFGCGVGGNALTFLMKIEGVTFPEAIRELGRRGGIELPELHAPASPERARRERLEQLNRRAAGWFRQNLLSAAGRGARDYLTQRGICPESAEVFGLGLALPDWDALLRTLVREGFSSDEIAAAGLAVARESTRRSSEASGYYDRFRNRLMIPIHDVQGRVIAFGGRVLGDGLPKYLNSSETSLFHKGRVLYALDRARESASRHGAVVVVEGYFDAIGLHQAGVTDAVATLGTALTADHVRMLRRYVTKVVLTFDPDTAGVRAALRALDVFVDSGLSVRVVLLPDGEDPDTFVQRHGAQAFRSLQEAAPTLLDFAVDRSLAAGAVGSIEERIRSVDEILRILQKAAHPIEREACIRRVAERLGINEQRLIERYPELLGKARGGTRPVSARGGVDPRFKGSPEERDLVHLLVHGQLTAAHVTLLDPAAFTLPACRRIVEIGLRHRGADGRVRLQPLLTEAADDGVCGALVTELSLAEPQYDDVAEHARGCLDRLERKRREQALGELIVQLRAAEREGRVEDVQRLNEQVNELRLRKASIGSPAGYQAQAQN